MTNDMPRHFRQTLAELELVSHGTTVNWNSSGGGDEATTPPGEINPPHIRYRTWWINEHPDKRHRVEEAARDELENLRGHGLTNPHDRASITVEQRVLVAVGYQAEHVAESTGLAANHVRRIRQRFGQDPETGNRPPDAPATRELDGRVLELHTKGCTLRQIELTLGIPRTTLTRIIKKDAA